MCTVGQFHRFVYRFPAWPPFAFLHVLTLAIIHAFECDWRSRTLPKRGCTIGTTNRAQSISRISMKLCLYVALSEL